MYQLFQYGSDWKAFRTALSSEEIADACRIIARPLPPKLLELFRVCNGGEGSLPYQPWNFVLWGLDDIVQAYEDKYYKKYFGSRLLFGSNGGGEYFGLDSADHVFFMDPIAGEESAVKVANSFQEFISHVGVRPPG